MLQVWRITQSQNFRLESDASNLDEVTQHLPEGYYSTFRTFDGGKRVLGLTAHLRRLYDPVATPQVDEASLRRQMSALLETYRPGEARVRVVMTQRGEAYLALAPFTPFTRQMYESGVRVETTELQRHDPRLKSTSFIGRSSTERKQLAQEGIFEALLVRGGKILEGMTSNFFYVRRQDAIPSYVGTAHDDVLLGVTRQTVIEVARGRGLEVKFEPLKLSQVEAIDEAFITSSSRGIVPVIQIDRVTIGQGRPGAMTKELIAAYDSYVMEKAETI